MECETTPPPDDLTGPSLSAYAKACGKDVAMKYVVSETGIDPSKYLKNGTEPDWTAIGGAVATYELGAPIDPNVMNPDGTINYDTVAKDAGSIAAVAVCTAYGAGAAAPLCGVIGGAIGEGAYELGKALYSVGAKAADAIACFFGDCTDDPPAPPVFVPGDIGSSNAVVVWYWQNERLYLTRLAALRGLVVTAIASIEQQRILWQTATKKPVTWVQMYHRAVTNGLLLPDGFASLLLADPVLTWEELVKTRAELSSTLILGGYHAHILYFREVEILGASLGLFTKKTWGAEYLGERAGFEAGGPPPHSPPKGWSKFDYDFRFILDLQKAGLYPKSLNISIRLYDVPSPQPIIPARHLYIPTFGGGEPFVNFVTDTDGVPAIGGPLLSGHIWDNANSSDKQAYFDVVQIRYDADIRALAMDSILHPNLPGGAPNNSWKDTRDAIFTSIPKSFAVLRKQIRDLRKKPSPKGFLGVGLWGWTALASAAYVGYRVYRRQPIVPLSVSKKLKSLTR